MQILHKNIGKQDMSQKVLIRFYKDGKSEVGSLTNQLGSITNKLKSTTEICS